MAVAVAPPLARTLADLADAANREHQLAQQAGEAMVMHALKAGTALLEAKAQIAQGEFLNWLRDHFAGSERLAQSYMRLARHPDLAVGATSLRTALKMVADGRASGSRDVVMKARTLHGGGGYTRAALAEEFGVSKATIDRWLDRNARQKQRTRARRERAARRALVRHEQEIAVRKTGGAIAEAYSLVRRTLQVLEQAKDDATKPEVKAAVTSAMQRLYGAEDEIGRAVRLS